MKTLAVMVLVLGMTSSALAYDVGETVPKEALTLKMKNVDNKMLSLSDVKGKQGTLVVFSCNHCPWAKAWEKRIVAIGQDYKKKGFGVIMVNSNDPKIKKADSFEAMKAKNYPFPYVVDQGSRLAKMFDARKTPESFLLSPDSKIVYHGAIDDNSESSDKVKHHYLRTAMDELAAGKKISQAETKSVGCGIKYY